MSNSLPVTWIAEQSATRGIPGIGVSVCDKDGAVSECAAGVHTQAKIPAVISIPLKTNNLFALSSQTKIMTVTAILQLIDKGEVHPRTGRALSLDDRLTDLLPQLEHPELRTVTLRDALSHNTTYHGQHVVNGHLINGEWLDGTTAFPAIDGDKAPSISKSRCYCLKRHHLKRTMYCRTCLQACRSTVPISAAA